MSTDHAWSRRRFLATAASGLGVVGLAACGLNRSSSRDTERTPQDADGWAGELVDPGMTKPAVTFTDLDGEPFPFVERTEGKLALLFFGYTSCPDVCPITLSTVARSLEAIGTGPGGDAMVLFVGVDTARDTPDAMRTYLDRIDPSFVGLTASPEVVEDALAQLYLPPPVIGEPGDDGSYLVVHSNRVFAFQADDGLAHRVYPGDQVRQQEWVRDLPRLAEGTYT
jgi:protein SCO1/2